MFQGREKAVFKDRREFSGTLLKQLKDTYEFIDRYNSVQSEIKDCIAGTDELPPEAIREALIMPLHTGITRSETALG